MSQSDAQILKKAKETKFNNDTWLNLNGKSTYEAMLYCYKRKEFEIGYPSTLQLEDLKQMGYKGKVNKKEILDWLIENKKLDKLMIKYNKICQGNFIKGKLRIQTYLLLMGYKNVG